MTLLYETMQMLGAYKKHPQAYLVYVEDCFLLSDNADASYIFKSGTIPAIRIAAPGLFGANFYRRVPVNQAVPDTEKFYVILFGIPPWLL